MCPEIWQAMTGRGERRHRVNIQPCSVFLIEYRWRKGGDIVDAAIITAVSQFIASVGFPIAAFAAIFWQSNTTIKEVSAAMQDNTKVLTTLATVFEKEMNAP